MDNSIVYGNTGGSAAVSWRQIRVTDASTFWMGTTCMQNNWEYSYYLGSGNIGSDPLVADAAAGNFRLSSNSPAIDAGSNYVDYEPMTAGFQLLPERPGREPAYDGRERKRGLGGGHGGI